MLQRKALVRWECSSFSPLFPFLPFFLPVPFEWKRLFRPEHFSRASFAERTARTSTTQSLCRAPNLTVSPHKQRIPESVWDLFEVAVHRLEGLPTGCSAERGGLRGCAPFHRALASESDNGARLGTELCVYGHLRNECVRVTDLGESWSGRRESNPRRPAWEAGILPLNYSRSSTVSGFGFEWPVSSSEFRGLIISVRRIHGQEFFCSSKTSGFWFLVPGSWFLVPGPACWRNLFAPPSLWPSRGDVQNRFHAASATTATGSEAGRPAACAAASMRSHRRGFACRPESQTRRGLRRIGQHALGTRKCLTSHFSLSPSPNRIAP